MVECPLCDWTTEDQDGEIAWEFKMQHFEKHTTMGQNLRDGSPDDRLCSYFWSQELINAEELEILKGMLHKNFSESFDTADSYTASTAVSRHGI